MGIGWLSRAASSPLQHLPAGLTIASATLVLLTRAVRVPSLERIFCGLGPMTANAAVCFLLAGVSLALCRRVAANRASVAIGEAFGTVVALIGTLAVTESLIATDWGIDRLLYFRPLNCDADVRMPPVTALAFVLFGLALAFRHRGRARRTSEGLASGTALLTSIPLLGVLYGASAVHPASRYGAMTPGAAATFALLCAGFFMSYPELHRSTPLYGSNPESATLRRLLLATLIWPAIGGWALVGGVRVGLYDVALGTAILVTLGFAVFSALILRNARDLDSFRRARDEAEFRFRDLVEFLPDGILTVNRNGLIQMVNAQAEKLFGHPRTELIGQSPETLLPGRFRAQHVAHRIGYQEQPRLRRMGEYLDLWALRKDGSEFQVDVSLGPMQSHGEPMVIAIVRDVTERQEAGRALRESEQRYRHLVRSIDEIVYVVETTGDPFAGRVVFVSDHVERTTGHTPQEFSEDPQLWNSLIHPDDLSSVALLTRQMFKERMAVTRQYRIRYGQTDSYRWVDDRVVPQIEPDGAQVTLFGVVRDITEIVLAEQALKQSEERYREMFMNDLTGAYVAIPAGRLITCNPAFASMFGFASVEEALGTDLASLYKDPEDRKEFLDALRAEQRIENRETEYRRRDDKPLHAIQNAVGVFDEGGDLIEIRGYLIDTTQRKQLEDQLRQAQKMEAVGRLAGGIAHDFNNILTVILGFSELLLASFEPDRPGRADVEEIQKAGQRASDLTRQLLAFSRRQVVQPVVLDVNVVLTGMDRLFRRLLGEDLDFVTMLIANEARVKMDQGQLEQMVTNLVVNGRDAMTDGGKLTVETSSVQLDELGRGCFEFRPGRYVLISVSDTGTGMDAETQSRIFEPFFTTKEIGRGTGLGLSTVYGIVKQARGFIDVHSEPGSTTFKIYLPFTDEPLTSTEGVLPTIRPVLRDLTILVVEDDTAVRELIGKTLAAEGCRILEAGNGSEALGLLEQRETPVDLVLTDVVMPWMGGRSLADHVGRLYPELKILFMSGYPSTMIASHGVLNPGVFFLEKPFSSSVLKAKVLETLRLAPPIDIA